MVSQAFLEGFRTQLRKQAGEDVSSYEWEISAPAPVRPPPKAPVATGGPPQIEIDSPPDPPRPPIEGPPGAQPKQAAFEQGFFEVLKKCAFLEKLPRTLVPMALQKFRQAGQAGSQLRKQDEFERKRQQQLAQYQQRQSQMKGKY